MTKYKELVTETQEKLTEAMHQIEVLTQQLSDANKAFYEKLGERLETEDAKEILRCFGPRAENQQELVLLIRALTSIKG